MSEFQFITSDQSLNEVENPYIEFLSINEAIKKGVVLPEMLTDDEDLDGVKLTIDTPRFLGAVEFEQPECLRVIKS